MALILDIHPINPQIRLINKVIEIIQKGGVIAYPTDSGYALGCSLGIQWSNDYDLLASIGSDFHGWPNQRVQIGNLADLPNNSRAIWRNL